MRLAVGVNFDTLKRQFKSSVHLRVGALFI